MHLPYVSLVLFRPVPQATDCHKGSQVIFHVISGPSTVLRTTGLASRLAFSVFYLGCDLKSFGLYVKSF